MSPKAEQRESGAMAKSVHPRPVSTLKYQSGSSTQPVGSPDGDSDGCWSEPVGWMDGTLDKEGAKLGALDGYIV